MKAISETSLPTAVQGQLLQLSEGHEVAIYSRGGSSWVAEFRDGHGELIGAATWFYFHAGALRYSHSRRATALESATALTPEVRSKIERLHAIYRTHDAKLLNSSVAILESLKRHCSDLVSRIHTRAAKGAGKLNRPTAYQERQLSSSARPQA